VDTRTKILRPDQIRDLPASAVYVCGHFDPMLPAYAERLEALGSTGRGLVVVLADPPDPLLPQGSRAELAASLAVVDWVVLPGADGAAAALPSSAVAEVHDETARHLDQRAGFAAHVLSRHGAV
jgi:hypothetical protein